MTPHPRHAFVALLTSFVFSAVSAPIPAQDCPRPLLDAAVGVTTQTAGLLAAPRERLDAPVGVTGGVPTARLAFLAYDTPGGVELRRSVSGGLDWQAPIQVWDATVAPARVYAVVASEHAVFVLLTAETDATGMPAPGNTNLWCVASAEQGLPGTFQQILVSDGVDTPLTSGDELTLDTNATAIPPLDLGAAAGDGRAHVAFAAAFDVAAGNGNAPSAARSVYLRSVAFDAMANLVTVQSEPLRLSTFATGTADAREVAIGCDAATVTVAWRDDRNGASNRTTWSRTSTDGGATVRNETDHADGSTIPSFARTRPDVHVDGSTITISALTDAATAFALVVHVSTDAGTSYTNNVPIVADAARDADVFGDDGTIHIAYELAGADLISTAGTMLTTAGSAADLIAGTRTTQQLLPPAGFRVDEIVDAVALDDTFAIQTSAFGEIRMFVSADAGQRVRSCLLNDPANTGISPIRPRLAMTSRGDVIGTFGELFPADPTMRRIVAGGLRTASIRFDSGSYVAESGSTAYANLPTIFLVSALPPAPMQLLTVVDGFAWDFAFDDITIYLLQFPGFLKNADTEGNASFSVFGLDLATFVPIPWSFVALWLGPNEIATYSDTWVQMP